LIRFGNLGKVYRLKDTLDRAIKRRVIALAHFKI